MKSPFLLFLLFVSTARAVDFNRDVRPVLAQQCFTCHGMDDHGRKGKLRLDLSESAYGQGKSGEIAIVPGKPDASEVVKRILSTDEDEVMPPPHTKKVLSDKDKAVLKAWIAEGAKYETHWAYTPPNPSKDPKASIDHFIRERLEKEGLKPSTEADRYTLVRRVYLDLTGLPPTPAEADAFVNDKSPDAYDKLVDSLLASKNYGERWARRWLDLARYADTNGFEKDRPRQIWPYRDWVVKALNDDMSFDQFSIKQLAGDMLPNAKPDDLIATGFHRNTMLNEEGGIDPNEYRFYAMVDRVGVTGATWFGLTLNCCQCHTHKYDPILHTDFYSIMALLNNANEPTYNIPTPEIAAQEKAHAEKIAKLEAELPSKFPGGKAAMESRFAGWMEGESHRASKWEIIRPTAMKTTMPHLELQPDGFILGSGDISKSDVYDLNFKAPIKGVTALRIEVASHPSLPNDGPGLTYYEGPIGGFFLSELQAFQSGKRIGIKGADATNDQEADKISDASPAKKAAAAKKKTNNASAALDAEMSSGWQVLGGYGVQHAAVFHFEKPVDLTNGFDLKMLFEKHFACPLGHFRISVTTSDHATATGHPADVENALATNDSSKRDLLLRRFLETAPETKQAAAQLAALRKNPPRGQPTLVMNERPASNPRITHRYHRGEYLSPKEEVPPAVPAFLPALPKNAPANRLTFAKWLFSPENPLTARVTVNRQWQAFFGRGLVKSLEDFGYQSEPPSHPQLLDWLAVEFVKQGWSMKKLHRLIVTSATYKQGSRITPELAEKDPENILLARGSRFRLDAEIIRDSALKAAGVLSPKMGGPGVFPPQPVSVTSEGTYGKFEWKVSEGDDHFRRSLYTFMKRTAPFAMSTTFDAPTGESCLARREVSNSPLQALTLLNDQMFMEAAQAMAKKVIAESSTDEGRLQNLFRRCATRPAAADEIAMLKTFLAKERAHKLEGEALWTSVCRAALNLDETVTHP
ncbi:PSD1 and planctomycete cytochrome C domain-containing protein [Prosthecobacter sp.]|uniref:PSD1 and planctomycete cytochrome C domain-containing protein n=1 Tax=Prosthecobacter sp. TaxID=1965333 RepID=UPI001D7CF3F4|nr:PSD1 and planctomycete cytochrome C domain-containing protein [Prosthecobacter sp.]MCB1278190.1 PSD1 domain-containing protein [Prosthecobacter sp.]